MAKVLPYIPSFGEQLGPVLAKAGGTALEGFKARQGEKKDTEILNQLQNPKSNLTPLQKISLVSRLTPARQKAVSELYGPILQEQEKAAQNINQLNMFSQGTAGGFANQFQGGMPQQQGNGQNMLPSTHTAPQNQMAPGENFVPPQQQQQQQPPGWTDQQLTQFAGLPGVIGNAAKAEIQRRQAEKTYNLEQEKFNYKKTTDAEKKAVEEAEGLATYQAYKAAGFQVPPEHIPGTSKETYKSIAEKGESPFSGKDLIRKREGIIDALQELRNDIKYTGSTWIPLTASNFGKSINRPAVEKRAQFDVTAFTLEGFLRELATKGTLPVRVFDKLIEQLPSSNVSERTNMGRINAIESAVKRYFPEETPLQAAQNAQIPNQKQSPYKMNERGLVPMVAPNGKPMEVPPDKVQELLSQKATLG